MISDVLIQAELLAIKSMVEFVFTTQVNDPLVNIFIPNAYNTYYLTIDTVLA